MKVLIVTEPSGGGSGRHVVDLASGLIEMGHDVCAVYSDLRAEPRFVSEIEGLKLRALEKIPMRRNVSLQDLSMVLALRDIIKRIGPFDIVHGHSSKAGALLRVLPSSKAARIYTPHAFRTMDTNISHLGKFVYGGVEWALGNFFSDAIIAVAPEEAAHSLQLGIQAEKVHTVINGISPYEARSRSDVRAELGIAEDEILVGFVGRLSPQKDPRRFVEAIRAARKLNNRVRGIMFGDGELAHEINNENGVLNVYGGLEARRFLPAFDLFAMTSRYEAMPYVLLEALDAGLPIISTLVGGSSIAIRDGINGRVMPVDATPEMFAFAINDMIPRLSVFGSVSKDMSRNYTKSIMCKNTVSVYHAALARRNR